jgi:hypothetical protein
VLAVEASKALRKGEGLTLDYGPDKLDNTLLLDYGVLDTRNPKVVGGGIVRAEEGARLGGFCGWRGRGVVLLLDYGVLDARNPKVGGGGSRLN